MFNLQYWGSLCLKPSFWHLKTLFFNNKSLILAIKNTLAFKTIFFFAKSSKICKFSWLMFTALCTCPLRKHIPRDSVDKRLQGNQQNAEKKMFDFHRILFLHISLHGDYFSPCREHSPSTYSSHYFSEKMASGCLCRMFLQMCPLTHEAVHGCGIIFCPQL